jgi:DNA-binding transcriptional regulator YiaG
VIGQRPVLQTEAKYTMTTTAIMPPNTASSGPLDSTSPTALVTTGEVEIAGRRYLTADRLAATLGVTVRTLARWDSARIGPPKIKIGKLVLFELAKLPTWLATREIEPVRATGRRR